MEPFERLQQLRAGAGYANATDAARAFGWNENTYRSHENGERGLRRDVAEKYARAFRGSAGWLLTGEGGASAPTLVGDLKLAPEVRRQLAPVAGIVQGGQFREVEDFGDFIHAPMAVDPDPDFPDARQVVFIAAGDSMDAAEPAPMKEGARVVCVDFEDIGIPIRDGMQVVIQRDRDGGSLREWSVKEIRLHADEVECIPRSTNPRHRPFRFPLNPGPNDDVTVVVLALVREVVNRVPLPR